MLNNYNQIKNNLFVSVVRSGHKKGIISGSRGYIGSNLLGQFELLKQGNLFDIDIDKIDFFIHLAAQIQLDDLKSFLNNIVLDNYIFDYCAEKNIKLIYASTNNVYEFKENCKETDDYRNNDTYSLSKILGETMLFSKTTKTLNFAILRIGDVFGKNQNHGNFFKALQKSILENESIKLYGDGSKIRNYIYIKELLNIVKFFIENPENINNEAYNICFSESYSIKQIVENIAKQSSLNIEKIEYIENSDIRTMKNDRLKKTGYKFLFDMESGLEDYVKEIQQD